MSSHPDVDGADLDPVAHHRRLATPQHNTMHTTAQHKITRHITEVRRGTAVTTPVRSTSVYQYNCPNISAFQYFSGSAHQSISTPGTFRRGARNNLADNPPIVHTAVFCNPQQSDASTRRQATPTHFMIPRAPSTRLTKRSPPTHNALGASNVCLVGESPTCSVPAL